MATIAEIGMVVSASGVQQGLAKASSEFKKFQEESTKSAEAITQAWDLVKVALAAMAGVETVKKILDTTDAFHKLELQLGAVTGSAATGRGALAWVEEFASKTPYSVEAVSQAFERLYSVGVNPMAGALQTLADANAAFGGTDESLAQLVGTIVKLKDQTTVSFGMVQKQLSNEIPGAARIMAAQLGMSMDQMSRAMKAGAITGSQAVDALMAGLHGHFGGAALAEMNTFGGAWKQLGEELDQLYVALGQSGITDLAIQGVHLLTEGVVYLKEHVGEAREAVAGFLVSLSGWIERNQTLIVTVLAVAAAVAAWQIMTTVGLQIMGAMVAVTAVAKAMWLAITGPAGWVAIAVASVAAFVVALITNVGQARTFFAALWDWLATGWQRIFESIEAMARTTWKNLWAILTGGQTTNVFAAFSESWAKFAPQMQADWETMTKTGIGKGLDYVFHGGLTQALRTGIQDVAGGIAGVAATIQQAGGTQIANQATAILPSAPSAQRPSASSQNIWPEVISTFQESFGHLTEFVNGFGDVEQIWTANNKSFLDNLTNLFESSGAAGKWLDGIASKFMGSLGNAGKMMEGFAKDLATQGPEVALINLGLDLLTTSAVWKEFSQKFQVWVTILQTIFEPLLPVLNDVAQIFADVAKAVAAILRPLLSLYLELSLTYVVMDALTQVMNGLLGVFGISVPSLTAAVTTNTTALQLNAQIAADAMQRAQAGILGATNQQQRDIATQAFLSARAAAVLAEQQAQAPTNLPTFNEPNTLADLTHILTQILGILTDVWNAIGQVWNAITAGLSNLWNSLSSAFNAITGAIWNDFTTLWYNIAASIGALANSLWGAFEWLWGQMWNGIGNILNQIWNVIKSVLGAINSLLGAFGGGSGSGNSFFGFSFAAGSNLISGGPAMLHPMEAVVPARYNPSNPQFDPSLWAPAFASMAAAGGGGQPIIVVMDSQGNVRSQGAAAVSDTALNSVRPALLWLQKMNYLAPGTVS